MPSICTSSTPAPSQPMLIVSAPRTACLHLPLLLVPLTYLCRPQPAPSSLTASRVFPVCVFPSPLRPCSPSLVIRLFLASNGVWFPKWVSAFERGQGSRAPPLPGSYSPLTPPPCYFEVVYLPGYPITKPLPPLSLPHI